MTAALRRVLCLLVSLWSVLIPAVWPAPAAAQLHDGSDPEAVAIWQKLRAGLFAGRPISLDHGRVIRLDAPARAVDAATVPIAVRAQFAQTPERHIRRVWLIIDRNPSPIAAIFTYTLDSGRADIETRVRVDEYSHVRAIAETQDGQLTMATRWVKASGGCSAPAGLDARAALATLGLVRLRIDAAAPRQSGPQRVQLVISHPNHSGLAMDQATRQFTPAHFVRQVEVSQSGRPVLSADLDFAISENPNLWFWFMPLPGKDRSELKVEVSDSQGLTFETLAKVDVSND